jgi:prepilin-type processing-associated H-X9-DG protein
MRRTQPLLRRTAFTLAEALVAVGIIIVLVSFLVAGLTQARESSRRAVCANNLRQVMSAISVYASANDKQLPMLPDWSRSQHWLCDIGRDQRDALLTAGLQRDSFYCPSGDLQNANEQWNFGSRDGVTSQGPNYTVTGYFWMMYRVRRAGTNSPVWIRDENPSTMKIKWPAVWLESLTQTVGKDSTQQQFPVTPGSTVLVSDLTMSVNTNGNDVFTGIGAGQSKDAPLASRSNHLKTRDRTKASGGNILFLDGHVEWRDFSGMTKINHSDVPSPGHDEWF